MESDYLSNAIGTSQGQHPRRAYVAPAVTPLSAEEAKDRLLRNADPYDPVVRQMLDRIEKILGREASE
jgi:hypothetical protein